MIVKLGGSLLGSADLDAWLSTIFAWGGPAVVVPGGGIFADHVRAAQTRLGFDDETAHRLALLAMDQVAVLLAAGRDRFALTASPAEMMEAVARGRIAVWLPSTLVLAAPDVPASWDVTSDSLAAWLAGTLGVERLLLVKSRDVAPRVTARDLAAAGIVDPLFPRFAEKSRARIFVAGPASLPRAGELPGIGEMPGVALTPHPRAHPDPTGSGCGST